MPSSRTRLDALFAGLRTVRPRDVRIAVGVGAAQIGITLGASSHRTARHGYGCWWTSSCHTTHPGTAAIVLLAAGALALVLRRHYPRPVLLAVAGIDVLYVGLGYPQGANYISLFVAFVVAMMAGYRVEGGLALVAGWTLFLWAPAALGNTSAPNLLASLALAAWLLVLFARVDAARVRRHRADEARRLREEEARRRANEERLEIARELHDVLAHSISVINVQSGVALHLLDERPEQARSALAAINEASSEALREVRSVLNVLRGEGRQAPRSPAAGLARLDDLLARAEASGVGVALEVVGERRPLPPSVDLAAFRIVQEAVTNIVRHAGAAAAGVRITYGRDDLTVEVDDDGTGDRPSTDRAADGEGGGKGIAGMRERALALGGEFEAGPRSGGGFHVHARLPLDRR